METRKLSDVLAQLQQKQGEANDKIIMSRDGKTYSMGATQMYPATENNSGVMTAEHVAQLGDLNKRLSLIVGNASDVTLSELDNLNTAAHQGWYRIKGGANDSGHVLVSRMPVCRKITQLLFGAYTIKDGVLSGEHANENNTILVRYYGATIAHPNGEWSEWRYYQQTFLKTDNSTTDDGEEWTYGHTKIDEIISAIPTVQTSVQGTNKNYVYSKVGTAQNEVLSGTFKVYQYNGKIRVTHKLWGSTTDYSDGMYHSADFPTANSGADGAMSKDYVSRLNNTTLGEANSTTDKVAINYPNYASGGNKTMYVTAATSAKAGVMTTDHVKQLSDHNNRIINLESTEAGIRLQKIESHYRDLGYFENEDAALAKITDLSVCADPNVLHAHLTYTTSDHYESSMILVQEIEGIWTRQILVNHTRIFQRTIYFKNYERKEIDWKEDWQYLFCDRLTWNTSERKYIPSQFGNTFNSEYTDQIPLASDSIDGLMSKEDKALLEKIKKQLNL